MIKVENVFQRVPIHDGELTILNNISTAFKAGESVAIVGASGSGKTTLLSMLAGLDTPSEGSISIDNVDITQLDEEQRAKVRANYVSFVFQNFHLLESLTALENVMLPLEVKEHPDPVGSAKHYLQIVGLEDRHHHYPPQLSGGEQQRVALARAFASESPILFADEPTGNLDTATGERIADLLFTLNSVNEKTLILVTHDPKLANRCARQITMVNGQLQEQAAESEAHRG